MLEERLGLAQKSSNLSWGPHERPVDLVAAIGMASNTPHTKLGAEILRAFVGNDSFAYQDAVKLLARRIKAKNSHIPAVMRSKLAYRAMHEFLFPNCVKCTGTGVAMVEHKKTHCRACSGTGRHVFGDGERAKALGISKDEYRRIWEDRLGLALNIASSAYNSVIRGANKRR